MVLDFQLQDLTHADFCCVAQSCPSIAYLMDSTVTVDMLSTCPKDVASFATSLPRLPSELNVIVVRKEGGVQSHRDFYVRRSVVLRVLQWLVANNIYYRNVHIDPSALALLPEDDLSGLHSMTVDSPSDNSEVSSTQDIDPFDANLSRTFVPLTPPRMTEQEAIRHSVQERQSNLPSIVPLP